MGIDPGDKTMTIKDILVHLDASPRSKARLAVAADLASRCSAHLAALYVVETSMPSLVYGDPSELADARFVDEMITKPHDRIVKEGERVQQEFYDRLRRDGIEGEWRMVEGSAAETVALHARYADLAILGQRDPSAAGAADVVAMTLLSSGRPALALPYAGDFHTVGRRVLVGWKASREASRAVNDCLPLLRQADAVTILSINPEGGIAGDGDVPAADIALHLARHGVKTAAAYTVAKEISEGDTLLNYADDIGADLIVAGGYGHSRARELVFGGVTQTLLTTMTVPVFLSH